MRMELLGLELERALKILEAQNVRPRVDITRAPGRADDGILRVVYASDDGLRVTAAAFDDQRADERLQ